MAASKEDYLAGEELDELFSLLDGGFLDESFDLEDTVNNVVPEKSSTNEFRCEKCEKFYKTQRGLNRHVKIKHDTPKTNPITATTNEFGLSKKEEEVLKKLHPLQLRKIVVECADTCFNDLCLPEDFRNNFSSFTFSTDDAVEMWKKLHCIISDFHGDAEVYYGDFYGLLTNNILPDKFENITVTNALLTEVANSVLVHLSGSDKFDTSFYKTDQDLSTNELKSLQYIAGFVVHKLYVKLRFKSRKQDDYNNQALSVLLACKIEHDASQTYVNIRDRGGLWKVSKDMQTVFIQCERIFRGHVSNFKTSVDCKTLVIEMLQNTVVISCFKDICYIIEPKVHDEISFNVFESMLTLFTRVRTFSFARGIRERHRFAKRQTKKSSLRTEIKKSSISTDMGH